MYEEGIPEHDSENQIPGAVQYRHPMGQVGVDGFSDVDAQRPRTLLSVSQSPEQHCGE